MGPAYPEEDVPNPGTSTRAFRSSTNDGTFRNATRSTRPPWTVTVDLTNPAGESMASWVVGSLLATMPVSTATVESAIIP